MKATDKSVYIVRRPDGFGYPYLVATTGSYTIKQSLATRFGRRSEAWKAALKNAHDQYIDGMRVVRIKDRPICPNCGQPMPQSSNAKDEG